MIANALAASLAAFAQEVQVNSGWVKRSELR